MAPLKFTKSDRRYLHSIRIDPEPTAEEAASDAIDDLVRMDGRNRYNMTIGTALKIIKEFGALTPDTIWAYRNKFQA